MEEASRFVCHPGVSWNQARFIMTRGANPWAEIVLPTVREPEVDTTDLVNRCRDSGDALGW
jgi:hypothetical protein